MRSRKSHDKWFTISEQFKPPIGTAHQRIRQFLLERFSGRLRMGEETIAEKMCKSSDQMVPKEPPSKPVLGQNIRPNHLCPIVAPGTFLGPLHP